MRRTSSSSNILKSLLAAGSILLTGSSLSAQKAFNVFFSNWQPSNTVQTYLIQEVHRQYDQRRADLHEALGSKAAMLAYRNACKKRYLQILGEMPARTPLHAQTTGAIKQEGYRIEKVIYESLPDHHVTSNLYIPDGKGPFPAVLLFCGHEPESKAFAAYQRTAILFAKNGFVVLAIDPISQGERYQLTDPQGKRVMMGGGEHILYNADGLLAGTGAVADELWDNERSLDYLLSRREVDTARIGCLGNSGGGTQTTYFAGFDSRIKVAAPCSYFASRERNLYYMGASDGCQHIPDEGRMKLEIADFMIMAAPKPVLILAGKFDFVDDVGVQLASRELQRIYDRLGHPDRYKLFVYDDGHGISKPKREVAVTWFRRWLCNDSTPVKEGDLPVLPEKALLCTSTGQVNTAFPHERTLKEIDLSRADHYKADRETFSKRADKKKIILQVLGNPQLSAAISVEWTDSVVSNSVVSNTVIANTVTPNTVVFKKVIIRKKAEIPLPCLVAYPQGPVKNICIWADEQGKSTIAKDSLPAIEALLHQGNMVILADLRATGETADNPTLSNSNYYFNKEYRNTMTALHIGKPLLGQQVTDMTTLLDFITAPEGLGLKNHPIKIRASGGDAVVALHTLALDKRISEIYMYHTIRSYYDLLEDLAQKNQYQYLLPGVLKYYDLPDLVRLAGPRHVFYE
ncbi:MAG TPA: acetylxylan esterase [Puia sp.]|nr:acetylxylan esterase [Puia sp.]